MTQDELEDELFLQMLKLARKGAGPVFDLPTVCAEMGIDATSEQLATFVVDNDGTFGSSGHMTHSAIRFELTTPGFRHAKAIERDRRTPKVVRSLVGETSQRLINVLNSVVAIMALVIALAAYFKDGS